MNTTHCEWCHKRPGKRFIIRDLKGTPVRFCSHKCEKAFYLYDPHPTNCGGGRRKPAMIEEEPDHVGAAGHNIRILEGD